MARVLVIEPDDDVRDLFAVQLRRLGHNAECAQDGLAAMFAVAGAPDVVILDMELSGEDALIVFDRLLASGIPAQRVLILTGAMTASVYDRTIRHGARALWRPLTTHDLAEAISAVIEDETVST